MSVSGAELVGAGVLQVPDLHGLLLCICCEVMYLALYLLHIPHYQQLWLIPVQLPGPLQQWAAGTPLQELVQGSRGLPVVGLVALLARRGC